MRHLLSNFIRIIFDRHSPDEHLLLRIANPEQQSGPVSLVVIEDTRRNGTHKQGSRVVMDPGEIDKLIESGGD